MRAFLVKYLFGRYWWKLPFQQHYNVTARGPFWFFNGFLLIAIFSLIFGFGYLMAIPWAVIVAYFGFPLGGIGYFEKHRVQWHELDDEQKWYYGSGVLSGELSRILPFDDQMMSQWYGINRRMKAKYNLT